MGGSCCAHSPLLSVVISPCPPHTHKCVHECAHCNTDGCYKHSRHIMLLNNQESFLKIQASTDPVRAVNWRAEGTQSTKSHSHFIDFPLIFSPYFKTSRCKRDTSMHRLRGLWSDDQQGLWPSQLCAALGPGRRVLGSPRWPGVRQTEVQPWPHSASISQPQGVLCVHLQVCKGTNLIHLAPRTQTAHAGNEDDPWSSGSMQAPRHNLGGCLPLHLRGG